MTSKATPGQQKKKNTHQVPIVFSAYCLTYVILLFRHSFHWTCTGAYTKEARTCKTTPHSQQRLLAALFACMPHLRVAHAQPSWVRCTDTQQQNTSDNQCVRMHALQWEQANSLDAYTQKNTVLQQQ